MCGKGCEVKNSWYNGPCCWIKSLVRLFVCKLLGRGCGPEWPRTPLMYGNYPKLLAEEAPSSFLLFAQLSATKCKQILLVCEWKLGLVWEHPSFCVWQPQTYTCTARDSQKQSDKLRFGATAGAFGRFLRAVGTSCRHCDGDSASWLFFLNNFNPDKKNLNTLFVSVCCQVSHG